VSPVSTPAESASQGSNPLLPQTIQAGRQHRCMKLTYLSCRCILELQK